MSKDRVKKKDQAQANTHVRPKREPKRHAQPQPHAQPKPDSGQKKRVTGRIVAGVSIALVLVFVIFMFVTTNFLGNNMLVTETAYRSVAYDVVKTTATVLRDEVYIPASSAGILVYSVTDGDKVTANGTIATAYRSDEDVANTKRIRELEERISYLEALNNISQSSNVGLDTVNSQLRDKLTSLIEQINAHSFNLISDVEEELMTSISRKQILTGEQGRFDEKIASLKEEKASLESSTGSPVGKVRSSSSGYFVSSVDGYENCVDLTALDEFYYSDYKKISPEEIDSEAYLGKVIRGVNWYLVCPVTSDEATNISHYSSTVSVRMPYALSEEIPAKVLYVNNREGEDKALVVLQCNYMSEALSKIRVETVELVVNSYQGLKISKNAIHDAEMTRTVTDENNVERTETKLVQGVYVEYGNELRFRQIIIVYAGEDYVICNENPDSKLLFKGITVKLYDQVVTEGGDLYDGKLFQ